MAIKDCDHESWIDSGICLICSPPDGWQHHANCIDKHPDLCFPEDDEFWRSNILSPGKLRKQYDRMRLQAGRDQKRSKFTQALSWMQDINWNEQKEIEK